MSRAVLPGPAFCHSRVKSQKHALQPMSQDARRGAPEESSENSPSNSFSPSSSLSRAMATSQDAFACASQHININPCLDLHSPHNLFNMMFTSCTA